MGVQLCVCERERERDGGRLEECCTIPMLSG